MRIRVSKKSILAYFLCFAFIPIEAVEVIIGNSGYWVLTAIASILILVLAIRDKVIIKSIQFIIWMVLLVWMTLCTLINRQSPIYPVYFVGIVAFWFLANDWFIEKGSLKLLEASRRYVGIVIVITLIQQILAPGLFGYTMSMNARTFFTSDNYLGYYYVAYIAVSFILDFVKHKRVQPLTYVMLGVCMASIIISWSVKSVIGIAFIVLYILLIYRRKIARLFGLRTLTILFVVIFIGVVFFNVQENFVDFFSRYFGKSSTLSVRYFIWTQALQNIKAQPIFGYGIRAGQRLMLQQTLAGNARSSHNLVLELILEGGFIGFGIYLSSVIVALTNKRKSYKGKNKYEYLFLLFVIFAFFTMELASGSIYYPFYYMPLILINNLDKIVEIKERSRLYVRQKSLHSNQLQYNN